MGQALSQRIMWFYDIYGVDGKLCELPLLNHISILEETILPALSADQRDIALEKTVELLARWPERDKQTLAMLSVAALYTNGEENLLGPSSYLGMCLADLRSHADRRYKNRTEEWREFRVLFDKYTEPPQQPLMDINLRA